MSRTYQEYYEDLTKGGPFIGPKGGRWADAKHTIPWKDGPQMTLDFAPKKKEPTKRKKAPTKKTPEDYGVTSPSIKERGLAIAKILATKDLEKYQTMAETNLMGQSGTERLYVAVRSEMRKKGMDMSSAIRVAQHVEDHIMGPEASKLISGGKQDEPKTIEVERAGRVKTIPNPKYKAPKPKKKPKGKSLAKMSRAEAVAAIMGKDAKDPYDPAKKEEKSTHVADNPNIPKVRAEKNKRLDTPEENMAQAKAWFLKARKSEERGREDLAHDHTKQAHRYVSRASALQAESDTQALVQKEEKQSLHKVAKGLKMDKVDYKGKKPNGIKDRVKLLTHKIGKHPENMDILTQLINHGGAEGLKELRFRVYDALYDEGLSNVKMEQVVEQTINNLGTTSPQYHRKPLDFTKSLHDEEPLLVLRKSL